MPKWKARRAKSTVERLMEFRERGGTPDMNASLVLSPVVKVVKKTVTEQTMAMDLLSSPTWMRDDILSKSDASPDKKNITGACQSGESTQLEGQRGGGDKDVVISQSAKDLIRLLENRPSSAKITLKSENHEKVYDNPFDPNIELSDPKLPDDYFEAKHLIDIADDTQVRPK